MLWFHKKGNLIPREFPLCEGKYSIIGDLKALAKKTPEGQRAEVIREELSKQGYVREEVWRPTGDNMGGESCLTKIT